MTTIEDRVARLERIVEGVRTDTKLVENWILTRLERVEGGVERIEAGQQVTGEKLDGIEERFERIEERFDGVEGSLTAIKNHLGIA